MVRTRKVVAKVKLIHYRSATAVSAFETENTGKTLSRRSGVPLA